ncbi:MAG: dethiobiotin synthase [Labilithrix sp.]|nr:dethiobiotin synthase [Labilithrix sp.]
MSAPSSLDLDGGPNAPQGAPMTAPLLLVTGTGTGIGKTVVAAGLVAAWGRRGAAVAGVKPIESGVEPAGPPSGDVRELGRVSTFHVTRFPPPYLLADPVSPHLAARRAGRSIDLDVILDWLAPIRAQADATVVELPGGLFSPLTDTLTNADLLTALAPSRVVLVAPDRLGVIHDVIATTRAARAAGIAFDGLILSAPVEADASVGTNAAELARVLPALPIVASLPRASADELGLYFDAALAALVPT